MAIPLTATLIVPLAFLLIVALAYIYKGRRQNRSSDANQQNTPKQNENSSDDSKAKYTSLAEKVENIRKQALEITTLDANSNELETRLNSLSPNRFSDTDKWESEVNKFSSELDQYEDLLQTLSEVKIISREIDNSDFSSEIRNDISETVTGIIERDIEVELNRRKAEFIESYLEAKNISENLAPYKGDVEEISRLDIDELCSKIEDSQSVEAAVQEYGHYPKVIEIYQKLCILLDSDQPLPTEGLVDKLNNCLASNPSEQDLAALDRIDHLFAVHFHGEQIKQYIDSIDFTNPVISRQELEEELETAVKEADLNAVTNLEERVKQISESTWDYEDLFKYDWEEFEHLVASLWSDKGYTTRVTQATSDRGIDVEAEKDGEKTIIQVKQYDKRNNTKVGRPDIQKTISFLAADEATNVVIVTTSSFTGTAVSEAARHGEEVQLVDGDQLIQELTSSNVNPPQGDAQDSVSEIFLGDKSEYINSQIQRIFGKTRGSPSPTQWKASSQSGPEQSGEASPFQEACEHIVDRIVSGEIGPGELEDAKRDACSEFSTSTVPTNSDILESAPEDQRQEVAEVVHREKEVDGADDTTSGAETDSVPSSENESATGSSATTQSVTENGLTASDEFLQITITGLWHGTEPDKVKENGMEGWFIELTIENLSEFTWNWNDTYLTLIDTDGYSYDIEPKVKERKLENNVSTRKLEIHPGAKRKYLGYVSGDEAVEFESVIYEQEIGTVSEIRNQIMNGSAARFDPMEMVNKKSRISFDLDEALRASLRESR